MDELQIDQPSVRASFWTAKRIILAQTLIFSIVIFALTAGFIGNQYVTGTLPLVNIFGWGVCMLAWIKADSRERSYRLHRRFPLMVVIFGAFALIYYLFRSRGFAGGIVSVAYFILFAILTLLVSTMAAFGVLLITVLIAGPGVARP